MVKKRVVRDPRTGQFKKLRGKAKRLRDERTGQFVSRDPFAAGIPKVFRRPVRF